MDLTYEEKAFFDVLTADPEVIAMVEDVMEQVTLQCVAGL